MKESKLEKVGKYLQDIAKKAITGNSESVDADGGNAVNHEIVEQILSPDFAIGSIYENCTIFNTSRNGLKIPCADTQTLGFAGIGGGVCAYWANEGIGQLDSKAGFSQLDLGLNKLIVTVPVTDELLEDASALGQYISKVANKAILYKIDHGIIYGTATQLNGITLSTATKTVTAASPIDIPNIKSMIDSYYGGKDGMWVMSKQAFNQVKDLYENTLALEFTEDGTAILFGYPIDISPVMANFDIVLGDFTQYAIAQKEIRSSVAMHVNFINDEQVFRFVIRINGGNTWNSGLTIQTDVLSAGTSTVTEKFLNSIVMTTPTTATSAWNASGTLDFLNYSTTEFSKVIVPSSVSMDVSASTYTFTDTYGDGTLYAGDSSYEYMTGTVDYDTGVFTLAFSGTQIKSNAAISATYTYSFSSYEHDATNDIVVYPFIYAKV